MKPVPGLALILLIFAVPAAAKKVAVPPASAPIAESRRFFTDDPDAPIHAPKGHDITIVEYLDYQCPYCRTSAAALKELMKRDKKIRVVFRDWPIFGGESERAARVAIAAKYQGKYLAVNDALMNAPRPLNEARIEAAARKAGANWQRLEADLKAHSTDIDDLLERNHEQAMLLGLSGTPGFIIGSFLSSGGMTYAALERTVGEARGKAKGLPSTVRKSRLKKK